MSSLTRIPAHSGAVVLSHTYEVGEAAVAPEVSPAPTYTVVDANGTEVSTGTATIVGTAVTAPLASQAALAHLTVTWTATVAGSVRSETDYVEIVGGVFFGLAEARDSDKSLADTAKYPTAAILRRRVEVEVECEMICDRAFVPRYRRVVLDGTDTADLLLQDFEVRTIRRVAVAATTGGTFVDLTVDQLAALAPMEDKTLRRTDGNVWAGGFRNIVVEYEYGMNRPPVDLADASKIRLRTLLGRPNSSVPDRAQSYTIDGGGSYRLTMPDAWETGIPDVDAAYSRYSLRPGAGTSDGGRGVPASRTLDFMPQRNSLFHRT